MKNVSDKIFRIKPQILPSITFPPRNHAVCEIMWTNNVESDRLQITMWHMRTACWITQATDTHSEHVILIAFPPQERLHERPSMLRYTYTDCLVLPHTQLTGPHVRASAVPFYTLLSTRHPTPILHPTVHTTPYPHFTPYCPHDTPPPFYTLLSTRHPTPLPFVQVKYKYSCHSVISFNLRLNCGTSFYLISYFEFESLK